MAAQVSFVEREQKHWSSMSFKAKAMVRFWVHARSAMAYTPFWVQQNMLFMHGRI